MNLMIITPIGCVSVKDERIIQNMQAAYEQLYEPRDIEERKISDTITAHSYKIETPFGYSCARNYGSIFKGKNVINRIFESNVIRDISFRKVF